VKASFALLVGHVLTYLADALPRHPMWAELASTAAPIQPSTPAPGLDAAVLNTEAVRAARVRPMRF
jgi:hypothetical protein